MIKKYLLYIPILFIAFLFISPHPVSACIKTPWSPSTPWGYTDKKFDWCHDPGGVCENGNTYTQHMASYTYTYEDGFGNITTCSEAEWGEASPNCQTPAPDPCNDNCNYNDECGSGICASGSVPSNVVCAYANYGSNPKYCQGYTCGFDCSNPNTNSCVKRAPGGGRIGTYTDEAQCKSSTACQPVINTPTPTSTPVPPPPGLKCTGTNENPCACDRTQGNCANGTNNLCCHTEWVCDPRDNIDRCATKPGPGGEAACIHDTWRQGNCKPTDPQCDDHKSCGSNCGPGGPGACYECGGGWCDGNYNGPGNPGCNCITPPPPPPPVLDCGRFRARVVGTAGWENAPKGIQRSASEDTSRGPFDWSASTLTVEPGEEIEFEFGIWTKQYWSVFQNQGVSGPDKIDCWETKSSDTGPAFVCNYGAQVVSYETRQGPQPNIVQHHPSNCERGSCQCNVEGLSQSCDQLANSKARKKFTEAGKTYTLEVGAFAGNGSYNNNDDRCLLRVKVVSREIAGKVVDSETGSGIPGVGVYVFNDSGGNQYRTTGADGKFSVAGFIGRGKGYSVRVEGNQVSPMWAPPGYKSPAKTTSNHKQVVCGSGNVEGVGKLSYECMKAGEQDCETNCNFAFDPAGTVMIRGNKVMQDGPRLPVIREPAASRAITRDGGIASTPLNGTANPRSQPYFFLNVPAGTHTVTAEPLAGHRVGYTLCEDKQNCHTVNWHDNTPITWLPTGTNTITLPLSTPGHTAARDFYDLWWHYEPDPAATFTVSGNVFVDQNRNGRKLTPDNDANYTASNSNFLSPVGAQVRGDGTYSFTLRAGRHRIEYDSLPVDDGYIMTYPRSGSNPPSFEVDVPCLPGSNPGGRDGSCLNGNVSNLNFGINNLTNWIQGFGLDIRNDEGIAGTKLPDAACEGVVSRPAAGGTPGVLFGNSTQSFGQGASSSKGWFVTNSFNSAVTRTTTYANWKTKLEKSGTTLRTDLEGTGSCFSRVNCSLSGVASGAYELGVTGQNLILKNSQIQPDKAITILVNGNVIIDGSIDVINGGSLIIIARGDIIVNPTVGSDATTCVAPTQVEGWFAAGGNFTVDRAPGTACSPKDLRLGIEGSVIAGNFANNRDICEASATLPTVTFIERPDMIINAPAWIYDVRTTFRELAP